MSEAPTAAAQASGNQLDTYYRWIWFEQPAHIRDYPNHMGELPRVVGDFGRQHGFERVIDASCGFGLTTILLSREGFEVVGTDTSDYCVNVGLRLCKQQTGKVIDLRCMNYADMGVMFGFEYFDAVVFHRLNDIATQEEMEGALQGCFDAIKQGGFLIWQGLGPDTDERAAADQLVLDCSLIAQHELISSRYRPEVKPNPLKVTHVLARSVGTDYLDEHHMFIVEPEGQEPSVQAAVIRKPYIWHGERLGKLLAEKGFKEFKQVTRKLGNKDVTINLATRG